MLKKLNLNLFNLSVLLSVIFLFFVAIVASVDNSQYFLHLLILFFTTVVIKRVKNKSEKLFWGLFVIGLVLIPISNIVVEATLFVLFIELVFSFYKKVSLELGIIVKLLNVMIILLGVFYLTPHIYPDFLDNSITIKLSICYLLAITPTFLAAMVYLLSEIFQSSNSRASRLVS